MDNAVKIEKADRARTVDILPENARKAVSGFLAFLNEKDIEYIESNGKTPVSDAVREA